MRYGVLLLCERIAPRTMAADSLLLLTLHRDRILAKEVIPFHADTWVELYEELHGYHVRTLVCGGIANETRRILQAKKLNIIDNVACTADEAVRAIISRTLDRGFGFEIPFDRGKEKGAPNAQHGDERQEAPGSEEADSFETVLMNCLSCEDRCCLRGETCVPASLQADHERGEDHEKKWDHGKNRDQEKKCDHKKDRGQELECDHEKGWMQAFRTEELRSILDAAMDITSEQERILCRVSELVYFCLEMEYRKIGIAFCMDLIDPARTLATLLERFFDVFPVGCKIGGKAMDDPFSSAPVSSENRAEAKIACNPMGQAAALNRIGTDLNVIVGLCMGHDCVFNRISDAPVTTLFVKDRSLANNPIGAMYSEYYLREVSKAPAFRQ